MKKKVIIIAIATLFSACDDDVVVMTESPHQQSEIEEIKAFVLPDTFDIKKELVIAAYYEIHPKKACVIFAYNDTTRTSAKKYSYSSDSSFVVNELVSVSYNEFKIKDEPNNSWIVKPTSVVFIRQDGNSSFDAEFDRIDVAK